MLDDYITVQARKGNILYYIEYIWRQIVAQHNTVVKQCF